MSKDTAAAPTSNIDIEESVDSEMVDSASHLSAESINLNSDKTRHEGLKNPKDPRTVSPLKSSLKSFRDNLTKNQETRSAGNLLTSSVIEEPRTTVKGVVLIREPLRTTRILKPHYPIGKIWKNLNLLRRKIFLADAIINIVSSVSTRHLIGHTATFIVIVILTIACGRILASQERNLIN